MAPQFRNFSFRWCFNILSDASTYVVIYPYIYLLTCSLLPALSCTGFCEIWVPDGVRGLPYFVDCPCYVSFVDGFVSFRFVFFVSFGVLLVLEVMSLLPPDLPVKTLAPFLSSAVRHAEARRRSNQVCMCMYYCSCTLLARSRLLFSFAFTWITRLQSCGYFRFVMLFAVKHWKMARLFSTTVWKEMIIN